MIDLANRWHALWMASGGHPYPLQKLDERTVEPTANGHAASTIMMRVMILMMMVVLLVVVVALSETSTFSQVKNKFERHAE